MDIDPLADTVPPRYALESDDEEDEYNPLQTPVEPDPATGVKIVGNFPKDRDLVVATGDVAKYWARGANLGEQTGGIFVNDIQVGLVFHPEWSKVTVIISEALNRLPVWAMHPYALSILDDLHPARISLLDTYPTPSYISEIPFSAHDAPIRYLATHTVPSVVTSEAHPFPPPNLIHSTSASFLSILNTSHSPSPGSLILVPSPHMSRAPPKVLEHSNFLQLQEDKFEWPAETIDTAQRLLFLSIGHPAPPQWTFAKERPATAVSRKQNEVGEGGMYI